MMTDIQLLAYCGIPVDHPAAVKFLAELTAERRRCYESMRQLESDVELWQAGLGPKPTGAILHMERWKP
jgi:hypothetical protein